MATGKPQVRRLRVRYCARRLQAQKNRRGRVQGARSRPRHKSPQ